jgi:hypothetical protein
MPAYEFYIEDSGYSALEFRVVIVRDEARAREIASKILQESPHYTGVEVRLSSRRLFAIGSLAEDYGGQRLAASA